MSNFKGMDLSGNFLGVILNGEISPHVHILRCPKRMLSLDAFLSFGFLSECNHCITSLIGGKEWQNEMFCRLNDITRIIFEGFTTFVRGTQGGTR